MNSIIARANDKVICLWWYSCRSLYIAYGERTSLSKLAQILKDNLSLFDPEIANIEFTYEDIRKGDVPQRWHLLKKQRLS